MIHDPKLLEALSAFATVEFSGEVFRATPKSLDPLTGSSRDGRWHYGSECTVIYTSLTEEGALAEISFHWSLLDPLPSKSVVLHTLKVKVNKTLKLLMGDLEKLGVRQDEYNSILYQRTQEIGTAVNFLGHDGLIIPSARWDCQNLAIFCDNLSTDSQLSAMVNKEVNWQIWARDYNLLGGMD